MTENTVVTRTPSRTVQAQLSTAVIDWILGNVEIVREAVQYGCSYCMLVISTA